MSFLLDTHSFLWVLFTPERLSKSAVREIQDHRLPKLAHKDPFDRIIVRQAIQRKMRLISADLDFRDYRRFGLKLYW